MSKIIVSLLAIVFSFWASMAVAATKAYQLNMELMLDGKKVSAPQMIVKAGKKGSITSGDNHIEVTASEFKEDGNSAIRMSFVVSKIDAKGKKKVISQSQLISGENQKAQISESDDDGRELMSLSVTANTTSL